jgi:hypothetical protein
MSGARLGMVVSGSLAKGLEVKLDSSTSVEDIVEGTHVVIEGQRRRFYGMITDVGLGAINPQLSVTPPDVSDPFIAEVMAGTSTYGTIHVVPMLTIGGDATSLLEGPQPVKTVPAHYSLVRQAMPEEVESVFGAEDDKHFYVGNPLDMEAHVCLQLPRFVERSSGVFGMSGTGKTFLIRMLLIDMIQKNAAVNLIFDMHNEYGWEGTSEGGRRSVKGLKQFCGSKVAIFTLDEESARRRGVSTDFVVEVGYDEIEPEDIEMLRDTLSLTEQSVMAAYQLARHFGDRRWLQSALQMTGGEETKQLVSDLNIHESTYRNLRRGLDKLARLRFLVPHARDDSVRRILEYLDRGTNVVLEFGGYRDNISAYVLVANMLTRRIHQSYVERKETARDTAEEPRPLVITIEEAHKFLNPEVADKTIFGTIAREMRKYNVTLLVIDQRPSGIDSEVMSQIATRISFRLNDERDIEGVLAGVSGGSELKTVLAKLETVQQALIFGHAVPMPVVVRTREYGTAASYRGFGYREGAERKESAEEDLKDLWS